MGYTTEFDGGFVLDKPLTQEHMDYLQKFSETRRMKRDVSKLKDMEDSFRVVVGLPLGHEGEFFVGGLGFAGQDDDASVITHNDPPSTQPGLWQHWVPNNNGTKIEWDGGEKFYDYVEWLDYMIDSFIKSWGYKLNGTVKWRGENFDDLGVITVKNNTIEIKTINFR